MQISWPVAMALLGFYNKLAIYWPASVSYWCYSCSLYGEREHDIPRPGRLGERVAQLLLYPLVLKN